MLSIAFISYIVVSAYTPGPSNLMALTNSAKFGIRQASVFCLGMLCGFFIDMSLCALLSTALFSMIQKIEPFMKAAGSACMFYIAYKIVKDSPKKERTENKLLGPSSFLTGLLMLLINLKVIIYGMTSMSSFVLPNIQAKLEIVFAIVLLSIVGGIGTYT